MTSDSDRREAYLRGHPLCERCMANRYIVMATGVVVANDGTATSLCAICLAGGVREPMER